jgi:RNA polymerase II subunit A small phosphatase-like protein
MAQEFDRHLESKPLLILDLDETLIHGSLHELGRPADMHVGPYHVYFRAGLLEFLARASARYRLAVWSSASSAYVEQISKRILADLPEPEFVWSRERCTRRVDFDLQEEYCRTHCW